MILYSGFVYESKLCLIIHFSADGSVGANFLVELLLMHKHTMIMHIRCPVAAAFSIRLSKAYGSAQESSTVLMYGTGLVVASPINTLVPPYRMHRSMKSPHPCRMGMGKNRGCLLRRTSDHEREAWHGVWRASLSYVLLLYRDSTGNCNHQK